MHESTPASIDHELSTVTRTVLIRAHRSAVWEAITTPELISEWFELPTTFERFEEGAVGVFTWEARGDIPLEIAEIDEPTVFAWRWGTAGLPMDDDHSTLVRFTLEEVREGTLLVVVESGFATLAGDDEYRRTRLDENRGGWDAELDNLVAFLERQDSV